MSAREELFEVLVPTHQRPAPGEAESANNLLDAHRDEATADVRVTMGKLLTELLETEYQLRLAQLELMKANVKRELAEHDAAGVKATLKELRADSKNKDVMYDVSNDRVSDLIIERDRYQITLKDQTNALKKIRGSLWTAGSDELIDAILKGIGL